MSFRVFIQLKGAKTPCGDGWNQGRSAAPSRSSSPPRHGDFDATPSRMGSRRQSRVARQHSYDDDIKVSGPTGNGGPDLGLGLPSIPRR